MVETVSVNSLIVHQKIHIIIPLYVHQGTFQMMKSFHPVGRGSLYNRHVR